MHHFKLLLLVSLVTTGCAYGYAGQEGKNRQPRPEAKNVEVVSVKDDDKQEPESDELPTAPVEPEASPCGVERFRVQQYAPEGLMRKTIDCRTGDTVDVERVPLSDNAYQQMRDDGYPAGKWYIIVKPKSVSDDVLNNDHLLQMSREYELDFFGRIGNGDQLIYLYLSQVR